MPARRLLRRPLLVGLATATIFGLGGAFGAPLGRSFHAAFVAFGDPERVLAPPPLQAAPLVSPPPTRSSLAPELRPDAVIDAELARDFESNHGPAPIDDSDASLASLSLPSLRVPLTRRTLRFVRYFTEDPKGRRAFAERLGRFGRYREVIEGALREAGLPEELAWVAAVESGFDPRAVSPAGAVGLWQLMPGTAASYGIETTPWLDDRRSVTRSTTAAVTHLRDLYERFGRWDLALAAYNYGAQGVADAVERTAAILPPDARPRGIGVAELASVRAVPKETASYVPLVTAFALVSSNRARFGFVDVPLAEPLASADVTVPAGTRLSTVARAAGVALEVVREHNPELLQDRAPPSGGDVLVHVPAERVAQLLASFPSYAEHEIVDEGPLAPAAAPRPDLDDVLASFSADGPALDAPVGVDSPLLAAWASLADPLPPRARWLGSNRVPELDVAGVFAPSSRRADGSFLALVGPRAGRRGLFDLVPPELLRGEDGRLARVDERRRAPSTNAVRRDVEPLVEGPIVLHERSAPPPFEAGTTPPPPPPPPPLPEPVRARLRDDVELVVVRRDDAEDVTVELQLSPKSSPIALSIERRTVLHVAPAALDVGLTVALRELAFEGVATTAEARALLRRGATRAPRLALERRPYGPAWLALGDALFPEGHPLEGWLLGGAAADDTLGELLLDARGTDVAVTLTLTGPVDPARVRALALAALSEPLAPVAGPLALPSAPIRLSVEQAVPDARVLVGWLGPREGDPAELALRVAMEMFAGKEAPLREELVERRGVLSALALRMDVTTRASVMTLELTPAVTHSPEEATRRVEEALAAWLADASDEGFERSRARLRGRLQGEKRAIEGGAEPGAPARATSARLREVLNPGGIDRALGTLAEMTVPDVRDAARTYLTAERAVVVTTLPRP